MECDELKRDRIFCHFEKPFAFLPTNKSENQNFEKTKKAPGDMIILHMSTKNHLNMMYVCETECDSQNFLFWAFFCPFTPLTTQKIKILKLRKKPWRYYTFTHAYHK